MNLSIEELRELFKLARKNPWPQVIPAPAPAQEAPRKELSKIPDSGSDRMYVAYAANALEEICERSKCGTCLLHRGPHKLCVRNEVLREQRRLESRDPWHMAKEDSSAD